MELEKTKRVNDLIDLYGNLLTVNQLNILELYYMEDLSLKEISEELNVSRNAVHDSLKRSLISLEDYEEKLKLLEKGIITNSLKEINKFLIKSYSKKLLLQYQQNSITYEQITTQLAEYVSSLTSTLRTGKRVYEILSDEDLMESFEAVFGKSNVTINSNTEENSSPMKK